MNIELFMKQMNGEHKNGVIEKHIVTQYVPLETKIAEAKRIAELSCYKVINAGTENEQKIFNINTIHKDFYTFITLLKLYTDIDLSPNILEDYNKLAEKKYVKPIIAAMPEDAKEFNAIVNMTFEDEAENATAIGNVINRLFYSLDSSFSTIINEVISKGLVKNEDEQGESE